VDVEFVVKAEDYSIVEIQSFVALQALDSSAEIACGWHPLGQFRDAYPDFVPKWPAESK